MKSNQTGRLSVVIPVYNGADTIGCLCDELVISLSNLTSLEIILVMAGLNNASGDLVLIMDDDNQNPVSEVGKLYKYAISKDYDVVYTFYDKKNDSFFRNLCSR